MSYLVEKKVGDTVYVYEATNQWDAQKHQSRQTLTDLGKKDPISGEIIPPHHRPLPRCARDYGNLYVLQQMAIRRGGRRRVTACLPRRCLHPVGAGSF